MPLIVNVPIEAPGETVPLLSTLPFTTPVPWKNPALNTLPLILPKRPNRALGPTFMFAATVPALLTIKEEGIIDVDTWLK